MNAARFFMRREDYQPNQPRNPVVSRLFNLSCVKCDSVEIKIIGAYDEDGGELAVYLYCPRCRVRERLKVC